MAGLPGSNAMVSVGPPLSASGPIFGSVLFMLPMLVKLPLPSELRLWPPSVTDPEQLPPFVARSVLIMKPPLMPPPTPSPLEPPDPGKPGFEVPLLPLRHLASPAAVGQVKGQSAVGQMEASNGVIDSSKTIPTSATGPTVAVCDHAGTPVHLAPPPPPLPEFWANVQLITDPDPLLYKAPPPPAPPGAPWPPSVAMSIHGRRRSLSHPPHHLRYCSGAYCFPATRRLD